MNIIEEGLTFDDVLLVPTYSEFDSRNDVDTSVLINGHKIKYPIVSANMDTVTSVDMANIMYSAGAMGILNRHEFSGDTKAHLRAIKQLNLKSFCVGVQEKDKKFLIEVATEIPENLIITVDVAHGHSKKAGEMTRWIKSHMPDDTYIIAGNVCTPHGAHYLEECGAHAIKCGVGPGSLCSTRVQTGCGYPQLSAIYNIYRNKKPETILIADGGIKTPGDVVKALAAGADLVMIGSMLAGTTETPGNVYTDIDDRRYKIYRGQASLEAQLDSGRLPEEIYAEGIIKETPYTGTSAIEVVEAIMKGVRSGMSYCGANTVRELKENATFVKVTPTGIRENGTHGVYNK